MALTEITKGMSNAAEQINQNFQTGSVVDSGTNGNGHFVKFGDGTMIVRGTKESTSGFTVQEGSIWRTDNFPVTFPESFIDTNYSVTIDAQGGQTYSWAGKGSGQATNFFNAVGFRGNKSSDKVVVSYIAIGRWK